MSSVKDRDKRCKALSMRQMDGEMAKSWHEAGDGRRKFRSNRRRTARGSTRPGMDGGSPGRIGNRRRKAGTGLETVNRRLPTVRHNGSTLSPATRYCTTDQQLLHALHALATRLDLVYFRLKSLRKTLLGSSIQTARPSKKVLETKIDQLSTCYHMTQS